MQAFTLCFASYLNLHALMDSSDLPSLEHSLTASTLSEEDSVDREQYHDDLLSSILDARDDDLGMDLQLNDIANVNSSDRLSTQL